MPDWKNFLQVDAGSCRGGVEPRSMIHKRMAFIDQLTHSFLKSLDLLVSHIMVGTHFGRSSYHPIRPTLRYSWQKRDTSFECKHAETHPAYTGGGNHPSSTGRIIYIATLHVVRKRGRSAD